VQKYATITENDTSQWSDDTGVLYHFPKRYAGLLQQGTKVIYYKGKMKDAKYEAGRLSTLPHYFGTATIGKIYPDPGSDKGDLFATIDAYVRFAQPVAIKQEDAYIEQIPAHRIGNYWRDGVRESDAQTFNRILVLAGVSENASSKEPNAPSAAADEGLESALEGSATKRFVTTYERNPRYRRQAIAIHGLRCQACDTDMGETYGPYAAGLIHVHHTVPVSTLDAPRPIDPATELSPVCPNCHAVIHRRRTSTLTIAEVRKMLGKA
jgi:predicted HNH restriction endonuclease